MNVLFLTLLDFESVCKKNIYTDLLRVFIKNGHHVYCISPSEYRNNERTNIINENGCKILKLRIGNTQKTNIFEKGISFVAIEPLFRYAVKKYFSDIKFDLILYTTPPITFYKAIEYVKNRDGARTYLLLKDIFPQNAVDIAMLSKTGLKGILYRHFREQEKRLYRISDRIGCMSQANVEYVLRHNPEVNREKVEVCPNSVEPVDMSISVEERENVRRKYNIPLDRKVFVYGGNLGKPQGIPFMLKCLHSQKKNKKVFFLIIGNGTEYGRIEHFIEKNKPENAMLHQWLPKEDYDKVVAACDVGMIFLDHRFTIPNFPSRMLNYMQCKLPVLAVTDNATDIGKIIVEGGFGWWCESNETYGFVEKVSRIIMKDLELYGEKSFNYLKCEYSSEKAFSVIMQSISGR